jgi:hypothetical protein
VRAALHSKSFTESAVSRVCVCVFVCVRVCVYVGRKGGRESRYLK